MEEKLILISKITFNNASEKAYEDVSDDLAMIITKNKMTMKQGIITTMLLTKYKNKIEKEMFGE